MIETLETEFGVQTLDRYERDAKPTVDTDMGRLSLTCASLGRDVLLISLQILVQSLNFKPFHSYQAQR